MNKNIALVGAGLVTLLIVIGLLIFLPGFFNMGWIGFFGAPLVAFVVVAGLVSWWHKTVVKLKTKESK